MSSPFTTVEEFNNALDGPTEGAIYTFAQSPAINVIALLAAVGLFIWFIVATYSSHSHSSSTLDKSLNSLSTFIVVSLLSAVTAVGFGVNRPAQMERAYAEQDSRISSVRSQSHASGVSRAGASALALLGMVSAGRSPLARVARRKRRSKYRREI